MHTRRMTFLVLIGLILSGDRLAQAGTPSVDLPAIPTAWRVLTTEDGLPDRSIRAIKLFEDALWLGTDNGFARYSEDSWTQWDSENGLFPRCRVTAIDVDPQTRDVWLGTWGKGLFRFTAGRIDRFDQLNSGLAGNLVLAVEVVAGRIWAATNGGLSAYHPRTDEWDLYLPRRADRQSVAVTALSPFDGRLYLGTWGEGILALDPAVAASAAAIRRGDAVHEGRLDATIMAILPVTGKLWWVSPGGIYKGDPFAQWSPRTSCAPRPGSLKSRGFAARTASGDVQVAWPPRGLKPAARPGRFDFVYCAAAAGEGNVWIGTERGVALRVNSVDNTWIVFSREIGSPGGWAAAMQGGTTVDTRRLLTMPPDCRVRCLAADDSTVWLGTRDGLVVGTDVRAWKGLPSGDVRTTTQVGKDLEQAGVSARDTSSTIASRDLEVARSPRGLKLTAGLAVALYGPRTRTMALPGEFGAAESAVHRDSADLLAFHLAVEASNQNGGFRGRTPFAAVIQQAGYSRYGWGLPEDDLADFAQNDDVVGVVGYVDAEDSVTNVAALRTEVPIVSTDRPSWTGLVRGPDNPWVFRCWGSEPRRHRLLLDYLIDELGMSRLVAVDMSDRAECAPFTWWVDHVRGRDDAQLRVARLPSGSGEFDAGVRTLRTSGAEGIMTWCEAPAAGRFLRRLRELGMTQPLIGGPSLLEPSFLELAGPKPGTVIALCPRVTEDEEVEVGGKGSGADAQADRARSWVRFAAEYAERNVVGAVHMPPGKNAYWTFAATDHLLNAAQSAGPDREELRRALQSMADSEDSEKHYEALGLTPDVCIARLINGKWVTQSLDRP